VLNEFQLKIRSDTLVEEAFQLPLYGCYLNNSYPVNSHFSIKKSLRGKVGREEAQVLPGTPP